MGIFDSVPFNRALFFPSAAESPPPPSATDLWVGVEGAKLHVRVYSNGVLGESARRLVPLLLFHGNGEVVADYDALAPLYARAGTQLVVSDYRGYGQSTGEPTLRRILGDAHAIVAAVHREVSQPLIVMGRSLGGNCAAELCRVRRPEVLGYVFESAATDLGGLLSRRGIRDVRLDEEDRREFDPLLKLALCETPTLFLHGGDDTVIAPAEALQGHRAIPGSELVVIEGRGHNDLFLDPDYWSALARFSSRVAAS